jgi:hypothetical protein
MESANSYYDWQQEFKKSSKSKRMKSSKKKKNLIGLSNEDFRDYLAKWKKKNLE